MKEKVLICITALSLLLVLVVCINQVSAGDEKLQMEALQEKIDESQAAIDILEKERDDYRAFIDASMQYLNETEVAALAEKEWTYGLTVDGMILPADGIIRVSHTNFEIVLSEEQSLLSAESKEIYEAGKISGDFFDHLIITGQQPADTEITDGTIVQGMVYSFQNVQPETVILLEITDALKERLKIKTNTIRVIIRKDAK